MLKEIDLAAFGRRVHIYNAIKELKARAGRGSISAVSPTMSGYAPDSPGTISYAPGMQSHLAQDLDGRFANRVSEPISAPFNGSGYDSRQRSASVVSVSKVVAF